MTEKEKILRETLAECVVMLDRANAYLRQVIAAQGYVIGAGEVRLAIPSLTRRAKLVIENTESA